MPFSCAVAEHLASLDAEYERRKKEFDKQQPKNNKKDNKTGKIKKAKLFKSLGKSNPFPQTYFGMKSYNSMV